MSKPDDDDSPRNPNEKEYVYDEYGFTIEAALLSNYQDFMDKHIKRKALLNQMKDVKLTQLTPRKKLKGYLHNGVPQDQRAMFWLLSSGAYKRKENANANCESGSYYMDLIEKNKKYHEAGKVPESFYEVEKDISRTFPGHAVYESVEGQEKLKRVLQAYARRNKQVGYCQSMNFLTAFALLFMEEEDAFWLLASLVEDICAGTWSRTMIAIQVDSIVLTDLVKEKLPDLHRHFEKIRMSLLLICTKWFMCLFIGNLPTEAVLRLWDHLLMQGSAFLFKISIAILLELHDDLMKAKDPMQCVRVLQVKSKGLFDAKPLLKNASKYHDITKDRVEELRLKHNAALLSKELSPEQLAQLREQVRQGWSQPAIASEFFSSVSSTYKRIDNWYRSKKDKYNDYLAKQQVAAAKARNSSVFEIEPAQQALLLQASQTLKQPLDHIVQGIGVRLYTNGKKYQGNFQNNKREGYGVLLDSEGKIEYDGFWKADKREGTGHSFDQSQGNVYKGEWKADEFHGRGSYKTPEFSYEGDWKNGKQEGKGVMIFPTGDRYEGDWKNNQPEGRGTIVFAHGDRYEGDWKVGNQEGKGIMYYLSGNKYEGTWRNNRQEGRGIMIYANGDKYEGDWTKDKMEGKGTMSYVTGDKYEGEWKGEKREGRGSCTFADGSIYDGEWKNNKMNGRGVMVHFNGNKYDGEWVNGKKNGKGKMNFANGDVYDGEWRNDEMDGMGVWIPSVVNGGVKFEGEFESGFRIVDNIRYLPNGDKWDPPEGETNERRKRSSTIESGNLSNSTSPIIGSPEPLPSFKSLQSGHSTEHSTSPTGTSTSAAKSTATASASTFTKVQNRSMSSAIEAIRNKNLNKN